jgi:hypothetical protein
MKLNTIRIALMCLWTPLLLLGCAGTQQAEVKPAAPVSAEFAVQNCTVKLFQNGVELPYQLAKRTRIYKLKKAAFRIETSSDRCNASIGTFDTMKEHGYVADNAYAIAFADKAVAGKPQDDVLVRNVQDPRPDTDLLEDFVAKTPEIRRYCNALQQCPTQITGPRNYWHFLVDAKGTPGRVSDIRTVVDQRSMAEFYGLVPAVIYTKAMTDSAEFRGGPKVFDVLETHPLLLIFS